MLARSKLNSVESKISGVLKNNGIMTNINEERDYRELKESIRMKVKKVILKKLKKKIGIDEVIKRKEIINKISNIKQCHLIA